MTINGHFLHMIYAFLFNDTNIFGVCFKLCSIQNHSVINDVIKCKEVPLNPLGFSPLWFEPRSGHMWESQVLLTDGQVVFLRVLQFSPTFDERSARYK